MALTISALYCPQCDSIIYASHKHNKGCNCQLQNVKVNPERNEIVVNNYRGLIDTPFHLGVVNVKERTFNTHYHLQNKSVTSPIVLTLEQMKLARVKYPKLSVIPCTGDCKGCK